jgi:hypothetical protein
MHINKGTSYKVIHHYVQFNFFYKEIFYLAVYFCITSYVTVRFIFYIIKIKIASESVLKKISILLCTGIWFILVYF